MQKRIILNVQNLKNLFKMQMSTKTGNHNLKKEVTSNKLYTLRKLGLKIQNTQFNIYDILYCAFFKIANS